ncbi:MAG: Stk1 family PASTA domain-containing Ser/Thr kinase [Clostridia bacterium]
MEDKYSGKRLDGRYEIHELVGTGGMAHVYKAYDRETDTWVAIKILKEEFSDNSEFLRRFRNESRAIAMLSHDNIVKVFDVSFGDKLQYIVMEYISGITLKDYITRKGFLPWKDTIFFTMQILMALEHAHQNGIIHRDIKPQNIILLRDGKIKVTDFGIARFSQSETQTMTDKAMGSVHYIAPEQAKGEYTSDKADIYSVGVMMYEMLTGQLPFEADNAVSVAIMQLQAKAQRPRLIKPDIPAGLEEITLKAMEKNPSMRFRSASEMLEDFEKFRKNPDIIFDYVKPEPVREPRQKQNSGEPRQTKNPRSKKAAYLDNYEYEEELVRSKKHATGSMVITGIIAALILVVVVLGTMMVFKFVEDNSVEEEDEVLVPNFVGMNYYDSIENSTKYDDFEFNIQYMSSDGEPGDIIKQSPSSDIMVKIGKEIILYIVETPTEAEEAAIPNVVGETQSNAYNTIQDAGFVPRIVEMNSDTVANYVIKTEPATGIEAEIGSEVVIYVSIGSEIVQTTVPTVVGETLSYATQLLGEANLEVGEVEYDPDSDQPADTVLSIDPGEGTKVDEKTKVKIIVSEGLKVERTIDISVDLPEGVNMDIAVKLYVNGEVVESKVLNPYLNPSYNFSVTASTGIQSIVIRLDNQDYLSATVDFDEVDPVYTIESQTEFVPTTGV